MSRRNTFLAMIPILFLCTYIISYHSNTIIVVQKAEEKKINLYYPGAEKEFNETYVPYLKQLGFANEFIEIGDKLPDFTFVTAFSDNHAGEGRHLIFNMSKAFPERKVVVYSMGLSKKNQEWFQKACNVELRQANLTKYPKHVSSFKTYAFKPLIIAETLKEFGAVFWVDTSSLFRKDRPIEALLKRIGTMNLTSEDPHMFLLNAVGHTIEATTHSDMYLYLPPFNGNATLKRKMYAAGLQLVYRTRATMELVYKWYVLCALEKNCMAPPKAKLSCHKRIWQGQYGDCHRYDQSAINLILGPYEKSHLPVEIVDDFIKTERGLVKSGNITVICK